MSRNREALCLSSRYIHTGNSGVTLTVNRDVKDVRRAEILVTNGAFGAFRTELQIRGNDHEGMTAVQLRDLGLMFLDAASELDAEADAKFERESPSIVSDDGWRRGDLPRSLQDQTPPDFFLREEVNAYEPRLTNFFTLHKQEIKQRGQACEKSLSARLPMSIEERRKIEEERHRRHVETGMLRAGYRFLAAKRTLDLATKEFEAAEDEVAEFQPQLDKIINQDLREAAEPMSSRVMRDVPPAKGKIIVEAKKSGRKNGA